MERQYGMRQFLFPFVVPNESTPLHHTAADKAIASSGAGGADGLPVVAITSASMEFISNNTHTDEYTLTVTGNDYHHMLKPQTSATPSNISDQTIATDTTTGSDSNLLPSKSSTSIDKVRVIRVQENYHCIIATFVCSP